MINTDILAIFVTSFKNAISCKKSFVNVPNTNMIRDILDIFYIYKWIATYTLMKPTYKKNYWNAILNTPTFKTKMSSIKQFSKPGRRYYAKWNYRSLQKKLWDHSFGIVSTPKGIMTTTEAKKLKHGGEVLLIVSI